MSTAKFEKMEISLNENTKKILELFKQSLEKNSIDENIFKKVSETERKGLLGGLLFVAEKTTGELHNHTSHTFSAQNIDLDASAFVLFNTYRYYLNMVIEKMGISAEEAQNFQIKNSTTLLRDLLLRMAAIALKVKIDDADYGDKIIQCLNDFVSSINGSEMLIKKGWFSNKLTYFGIELVTNHDDWVAVFRNMINIIKAIHLPMTTISEMIGFLLVSKNTVARHILLRSKHPVNKAELSDDWIMNTFIRFEKKYSRTMMKMNSDDQKMDVASSWNAVKPNGTQAEILDILKKKDNIPHQKLKELFEFFNKTNLLFHIAVQVENLIQIGGWIPVINGLIKIDNLKALFSKYIKEYEQTIKISVDELTANSGNGIYHELIKYKNPNIVLHGMSIINHIELLKSPFIRQQIFSVIGRSISQLQDVDAEIASLISPENTVSTTKTTQMPTPGSSAYSTSTGAYSDLQTLQAESLSEKEGILERKTFHELWKRYESDNPARVLGRLFGKESGDKTNALFEKALYEEISNEERAKIVLKYLQDKDNEELGFCSFLKKLEEEGILFTKYILRGSSIPSSQISTLKISQGQDVSSPTSTAATTVNTSTTSIPAPQKTILPVNQFSSVFNPKPAEQAQSTKDQEGQNQLIEVWLKGDLALVKELESQGASLLNPVQRMLKYSEQVEITSKVMQDKIDASELMTLLKWATEGHLVEVEKLLKKSPILALATGTVVDFSDRIFKNITVLQYAAWALDVEMCELIINYLSAYNASIQLKALAEESKHYGPHGALYDFMPLVGITKAYVDDSHKWHVQEVVGYWQKEIRGKQQNCPTWLIYVWSEEGEDVAWTKKDVNRKIKREYEKHHLKCWFTSISDCSVERGWKPKLNRSSLPSRLMDAVRWDSECVLMLCRSRGEKLQRLMANVDSQLNQVIPMDTAETTNITSNSSAPY